MASNNDNAFVGEGSLGTPKKLSEEKTMAFYFHDFEDLHEKKQYKTTPIVCFGLPWRIGICPWGDSKAKEGFVSVYLHCLLGDAHDQVVKAKYSIKVGDRRKQQASRKFIKGNDPIWGWSSYMKRSKALEALDERGSLLVKVSLQIWRPEEITWKPKNSLLSKVSKLYNADDGKDIKFNLGDGEFVRAHRSVLSIQCPAFNEMISDAEDTANIQIENACADLFAMLIRFMYLESLPDDFNISESGVELLELANRFGYAELKMLLEADLVDVITVENAAEFLLLADGHSCALLKEAAMDLVIAKPKEITKTKGWAELKESSALLAEVFQQQAESQSSKETANERVSHLRKRLADAGLDADGTKETLVKRCRTEI